MKRLPDAEFDVMACIWQCDAPVTSGEIMRRRGSERGWKTPALITLLNRLIERGFLRSEKPGRENRDSFANSNCRIFFGCLLYRCR